MSVINIVGCAGWRRRMDAVSAALLSAACSETVSRTISGLTSAWSTVRASDVLEPEEILELTSADGGDVAGVLTAEQASQVGDFLRSHNVGSVLQARLIARIGIDGTDRFAEIEKQLQAGFLALCEAWCSEHHETWVGLGAEIWSYLVSYSDGSLPHEKIGLLLSGEEKSRLTAYITAPALSSGTALPEFIRSIVAVAKSPQRLLSIDEAITDISRGAASYYADMNLDHLFGNARYQFEELYIERTLHSATSGESWSSNAVLARVGAVPKCVVVGPPGAGKSTLVRHLAKSLAARNDMRRDRIAPLVFRCKEFGGSGGSEYLLEAIQRAVRNDFQVDFPVEVISDILAVGRGYLIFDGIDEVIDISRRQQMVKAIAAFSVRFPLSPVLVTGRKVGYERAAFDPRDFTLFELEEFTPLQVLHYVQKWFGHKSNPDAEASVFFRESESIDDVRRNPLMLSLLCALYKVRGYIPRNRLHVYRDCADLLFDRWDSMRHIEQHADNRSYGHRIMQELAYFYYRHQSAQGGVEERQLVKLISTFFVDTTTVTADEARSRARSFLEFCAGRAWLLSVQVTSNEFDERVFGFTHRTFMEYFAAETIVRRSDSFDNIADEVAAAYDRDPSSVLADVIVQCADDSREHGAEVVIKNLLSRRETLNKPVSFKYLALCLRVMNSSAVNKRIAADVFDRLFQYWSVRSTDDDQRFKVALAVFDLTRDMRNYLYELLMDDVRAGQHPVRPLAILRYWSTIVYGDLAYLFDPSVVDLMLQLAREVFDAYPSLMQSDWVLRSYALDQAVIPVSSLQRWSKRKTQDLLIQNSFGESVPGLLLRSLTRALWDAPISISEEVSDAILDWAAVSAIPYGHIDERRGEDFAGIVREVAQVHRTISLFGFAARCTRKIRLYFIRFTRW